MPKLAACTMQPNCQRVHCEPKGSRCRKPVLAFQVDPADDLRIFRLDCRQDQVNALACCGLEIIADRIGRFLLQQKLAFVAAPQRLTALVVDDGGRDDAAEPALDGIVIAQIFGFLDRAKDGAMQNILRIGGISKPANKVGS